MTTSLKYSLNDISEISAVGFTYIIPDKTIEMINYLTYQIGSSTVIPSNIFEKRELVNVSGDTAFVNKKRKINKSMEINNDDWETLRTFHATKIEQKSGFNSDIDKIRLYFNKLTDKTFLDMREKIIAQIEKMVAEFTTEEDKNTIAMVIYDLASTNKFYSRIFTELYSELATTYDWIKSVFHIQYDNIMSQYDNVEYVDSDKDYNKFCDMNKTNEKRKSTTLFLVNLANNGFIPKCGVLNILTQLLQTVLNMLNNADKKNEINELTENIAILFGKELFEGIDDTKYLIDGETIISIITKLAKCKVKDYPGLSNKSIFKYMDLVEI